MHSYQVMAGAARASAGTFQDAFFDQLPDVRQRSVFRGFCQGWSLAGKAHRTSSLL
jgi:hypothetical protein